MALGEMRRGRRERGKTEGNTGMNSAVSLQASEEFEKTSDHTVGGGGIASH